jgi:nucleotide-binding universal stress UspA family protein
MVMFKQILVPLDGSKRAERALPVAARIVRATGGSLVLLRVVSPGIEYGGNLTQPVILSTPDGVETGEIEATQYLAEIARSDVLAGIETKREVFYGASVAIILAVAAEHGIDAIVMGSHGDTSFKRWMFGSVAQKVACQSPVPVLVLHEGGTAPIGPHPDAEQPLRILVPLDGSPMSEAVLEPAAHLIAALAGPERGALHLLRVIDLPSTGGHLKSQAHIRAGMLEEVKRDAQTYLSALVARLREGPLANLKLLITCSVALDVDVAHAISRVAENGEDAEGAGIFGGCDLIAMATHGSGGLQRWAMGSVTERVLGATQLPLLVIRSQEQHAITRSETAESSVPWVPMF